jgi:hypothetical protein
MPRASARGVRGYQKRAGRKAALQQAALEGAPVKKRGRPFGSKNKPKTIPLTVEPTAPPAVEDEGVPYWKIKDLVERTNAPLEEVLALPMIPPSCLEDQAIIAKIRDVVERAQLIFRVNIRGALATKGIANLSVTALMGLARNTDGLNFDQQMFSGAMAPEIAGIEIKIDELLERLAKKAERVNARAAIAPRAKEGVTHGVANGTDGR